MNAMRRIRYGIAVALIVLPLLLAAGLKYVSARKQAAAVARMKTFVVLPAKVVGPPQDIYLSDAVAGTLNAYLERLQDMQVRTSPSSSDFEHGRTNALTLGTSYGVDGMIMPTVTTDGDLFMIDIQLADVHSRAVVWTDRYQGLRTQFVPLVRAAGEGVRRIIRPGSSPVEFHGGVSSNSQAELAFREGQYHRERKNFVSARAAFTKALDLDPGLLEAGIEIEKMDSRN
jgi:TolB-like protein